MPSPTASLFKDMALMEESAETKTMKTTSVLAAGLLLQASCNIVFSQEPSDDATVAALPSAITSIRKLNTNSHHTFLHDAAQMFRPACVGRSWTDVTHAIEKQNCPIIESHDNGDRLKRSYLVRKAAFSFPNGRTLDAYARIAGRNTDGGRKPSRPDKVSQADILLVDENRVSYEIVVEQDRYPSDSVLDVVLKSPEVQREGLRWPIMKRILVNHGAIITRTGAARGFEVEVEFTASLEEKIGGKRMYFFVRNEPSATNDGDVDIDDGESNNELGEVQGYGANEWWHGTPDVVAMNKTKYMSDQR